MKIGIVTQPLWGNYGGILQNYALQQVLRLLNHDPITLDYLPGYSGIEYIYVFVRHFLACLVGLRNNWFVPYTPKRKLPEIARFVDNHIRITSTFCSHFSKKLVRRYQLDAIIVGSDQVWRPSYNTRLYDMYLNFCLNENIKKIAYAASFGTGDNEYKQKQTRKCTQLLKSFDAVSVREESGLRLLEMLGRSDGQRVIDPTLLLGRKGFDALLSNIDNSIVKTDYLGCYMLDSTSETSAILEKLRISFMLNRVVRFQENQSGLSPEKWIEAIKNAKIFISDSFHGTVFCILYHVPFVSVINRNRGADRFYSLLKPLGLVNQIVERLEDIETNMFNINWTVVDCILTAERKQSLKFLKANL